MTQHNLSVEERLFIHIELMADGCWLWTGSLNIGGYGRIRIGSKTLLAHRVSYEQYVGKIQNELDHLCRNRACINYNHLEDVTRKENYRRGLRKTCITHCPKGHEYNKENTYIVPTTGWRRCKVCAKDRR